METSPEEGAVIFVSTSGHPQMVFCCIPPPSAAPHPLVLTSNDIGTGCALSDKHLSAYVESMEGLLRPYDTLQQS